MRSLLLIAVPFLSAAVHAQQAFLLTPEGPIAVPVELVLTVPTCPLHVGGVFPCTLPMPRETGDVLFTATDDVRMTADITGTYFLVRPVVPPMPAAAAAFASTPRHRHRHHARAVQRPSAVVVALDCTLRIIAEAQLVAEEQ